jgi:hypothetical protein
MSWIGNVVVEYTYPVFRHANLAMLYPEHYNHDWTLWTPATGYEPVGVLTDEMKKLECLVIWPLQDVLERIAKTTHVDIPPII